MVRIKYNKTYDELTKNELIAVLRLYNPQTSISFGEKKQDVLTKLGEVSSSKNLDWDSETLFYFQADSLEKTETCKGVKLPDEIIPAEYNYSRPRMWSQFEKFAEQIEAASLRENSDHSENLSGVDNNEDSNSNISSSHAKQLMDFLTTQDKTINRLCNNQEDSLQRKMSQLNKIKVEFDENQGVPNFIALVEEWASANNIYDDNSLIRKASAAITQSAQGMSIREALAVSPASSWQDFKQKLQELLGQDKSYYRKQFRTAKKEEYESFGVFLAKLTMHYKYAFGLTSIKQSDMMQIKTQFIDLLDQPLKGYIESEDLKEEIPFSKLAERASQIYRAHGLNDANVSKIESLNFIKKHSPVKKTDSHDFTNQDILKQMAETQQAMMKLMQKLVENKPHHKKPKSNKPWSPPTEEEKAELAKQTCKKWLNDECKYGEKCYRKHSKN